MSVNSRDEASAVINEAYAKVRTGDVKMPGEDPAVLALLADIQRAEGNAPQIAKLERDLEDVRLALRYPDEDTDVAALETQRDELEASLRELRKGQSLCGIAFEVRGLLRDAGKID